MHQTVVLILLVVQVGWSVASLNLFLNETETKRLLGIDGELFYIRDCSINNYALSFNIPLNPDIKDIYFTWQRLQKAPIFYKLRFHTSNKEALKPPSTNVPLDGEVPNDLSAIRVVTECTGLISTEVEIQIELTISACNATHYTIIHLNRTKICILDPGVYRDPYFYDRATLSVLDSSQPPPLSVGATTEDDATKLYIAILGVCGCIILVAIIVAVWYVRRSHRQQRLSESSTTPLAKNQYPTRPNTPSVSTATYSVISRPQEIPQELGPKDVDALVHKIQIDRKRISLREILLEGTFGRVYHATIYVDTEQGEGALVEAYIKTVTEIARGDQIDVMIREGSSLYGCQHPNINPLIATCLENPRQPYLIYQYVSEGNLKRFLQNCKISEYTSQQGLNTQQLVYLATQLARGMHYLHRQLIVHKDIAARNCVVDNQLVVRLCDRALSRDLFPNDYHCLGDNENRPVKWLALETILDRKCTFASDVWSFGVTLWEIMTLGAQPYADVDPFEMAAYLKEGYRVSQPLSCPDELFGIMACCWSLNPTERPHAKQLLVCLQDFYSALGSFI